jgi:hypothetical protein
MKTVWLALVVLCLSGTVHAESLGGDSKVVEFRNKLTTALGMRPGTPSKLIDIICRHIDTTGEWSYKFQSGADIYGDEHTNKTIRYFMVLIVKNGRTVVDTITYDPKSGQLILSEVENIVLSISAGVDDAKRMAADPAYEKMSESKTSAIYHKKGYLQEVAYSVNNSTNAIVKTYSDTFHETVPSEARATPPTRSQITATP